MKEMNVGKNLTNKEFEEFKNNLPTAEEASVIIKALQATIKEKIGNLSYILTIETKKGVSSLAEASGLGMINSVKATISSLEKAGIDRQQIFRDLFPEKAVVEFIHNLLDDFDELEDVTKN